ncbi:hypothetical protein [Aureimonas glaciei]|uniref:Uncharacterized protein n=1 Tax=Aureimonas glaciei TaxID=1776957 RepID=A0A916Y4K5_9HYPH|nr:hypothetical protein [Aureimonas glaciei]GGD30603.1 hypothetical protein GCM10011335_37060 [Aureimonas glaciei]
MSEKQWAVTFTITGRAIGYVTAATEDEAMDKAKEMDVEEGDLLEWEFDRPLQAQENR